MKKFILLFVVFLLIGPAFAATVPVRWLEGERGFEQAMAIQKETKLPVLIWATWHECPYCGEVTAFLNKSKTRQALKDYPHVVVDEHGPSKEAAFAAAKGFHDGNFYVISAAAPDAKGSVWAWKGNDNSRVIVDKLDEVLAGKLAAAK